MQSKNMKQPMHILKKKCLLSQLHLQGPTWYEVPVNDGRWTTDEYAELLYYIAQDLNQRDQVRLQELWDRQQADARSSEPLRDMERDRQRVEAAEHEAHQRSIQEWEAKVQAKELDNPALPCGPTPQGASSMRVLPNVHDALRQNDPKTTSFSQPVVKKAPPTLGRARPSAFYSDTEPPRIGAVIQPPPPAAPRPAVVPSVELPLAATPMTPSHPPRPPISALPKHPSMETSSGANKHPLEPPTAQAPPSKHVRCKAFPQDFSTSRSLIIRSMWQHQQQLRCLNPADHVQRVLQQISCLHLQKLRPCRQTSLPKTGDLE